MINLANVSKNYGKRILFNNVNLSINDNEKIGLIGPNGAGKSTLFSIILQEAEPSSGKVQVNKNIRIGYLPQESSFKSNNTVLQELMEGDITLCNLKQEKDFLEKTNEAGSLRYADVMHSLEHLGYFELEYKAKKILMGLGFKEKDFNRNISELSGGWQMRTLLARLLNFRYDILLLDEPTNYLDLNAALWFKDYLRSFEGTFIMISHDKTYLNEVTNFTLILENGSLTKVKGSYEHYQQIRAEQRIHLLKQYKEQEKKKEQLKVFISRFHAQPNKASQVRAKKKFLEELPEIQVPDELRRSINGFRFPETKKSGYRVMSLEKICKSYGDLIVYKDFDFEICQGEKAVLAGDNGAGKSTLLKILAGVIETNSGRRVIGHNVEVGYFSQTRLDVLNPDNTVLKEAYSAAAMSVREETIRTILGAFFFRGDDVEKQVKVISGGEKSRLILAKLLINPPNLLLLDEPTTHLDVDAIDALVYALKEYQGTIVFISHDIYFVKSLANTVYEVKNGAVRKFPGDFDYYLDKKNSSVGGFQDKPSVKESKFKSHIEEARFKAKQAELLRRQEEKRVKAHNFELNKQLNSLKELKDKLEMEHYAKARVLSNPRSYRQEQTVIEYGRRLKEIEKQLVDIENRVSEIKANLIK